MREEPGIALFPWGAVMEDWLDQLGLCADDFVERMATGWMFGYISALRLAGWRPFIVFPSLSVAEPTRRVHGPTGVAIWLVPGRRIGRPTNPSLRAVRAWLHVQTRVFEDILTREACRVILVQEYEFARFDSLVRLGHRMNIPVIATFQGGNVTMSALERLVRRASMRACSGLLIPSTEEARRVRSQYAGFHPPIYEIPNPIDPTEWRPIDRAEARAALGLPPDAFIAINHGRIHFQQKANDRLVEAWPAGGSDLLVVVGSGPDNEKFAALVADRSPTSVLWDSQFSTDKTFLTQWLSAADIYVSASRIEGMPVAPLEAMACGLPVVATNAHGVADIFPEREESGGLVVPVDDVDALRAAISRLRDDPELRSRMGLSARRRIDEHFAVEAVARSFSACLRSVSRIEPR